MQHVLTLTTIESHAAHLTKRGLCSHVATMTYTSSPRCFLAICLIAMSISLFIVKPQFYLQRWKSVSGKRMFGRPVLTVIDKYVVTLPKDRTVNERYACSPSKRICSTSAIRNCAVARNYFPEENKWTHVNATFPGSRFLPTFCRYKYDIVPPTKLRRCLQNKTIRHIVVVGDSHGLRYFHGLQRLLEPIANCSLIRVNSSENYFSRTKRHTTKLPKQRRHETQHRLWECILKQPNANTRSGSNEKDTGAVLPDRFLIERIDITSFGDITIPDNCSQTRANAATKCIPRKLFKTIFHDHFARDDRYPDVILYFSNSHDKGKGKTLSETRSEISSFRDVINRYVPRRTSFYWFNHLSENDLIKKPGWQDVFYEGKYNANEMILRTNRAMYTILRDDINTSRIHTFFDLHAMTLPLPEWSVDGVHLKTDWYAYLMSYWFQTACSKFM